MSVTISKQVSSRSMDQYDLVTDPKQYYELYYQAIKNTYMARDGKDAATAATDAAADLISNLDKVIYDIADADLIDPTTGKSSGFFC